MGRGVNHGSPNTEEGAADWRTEPRRRDEAKRCSKCGGLFVLGAFAVDQGAALGRQSYCLGCKQEWETVPQNAFRRFFRWLEKEEPGSCPFWTLEEFLKIWTSRNGRCGYCGCGLRHYQISGHCMDRISSRRPHVPDNCLPCCWPCNHYKGTMNPEAYRNALREKLEFYGEGKIPWPEINPRYRRCELISMEKFRVADPQLTLGFA